MKNLVSFLLIALLWPCFAWAGDGVGTVKELAGKAKITHAAANLAAQDMKMGDPVFERDIIETEAGARAVLHFSDDAELVITGKGKLTVEAFLYEPEKEGNKALLEILGTAFSYVGGMIDKDKKADVKLKFDYGTLGIRGTKVFGVLRNGLDWLYLEEGAAKVENAGGNVDLKPGQGTRIIDKSEAPNPAYIWGEAEIGWIKRLVDDPSAHETHAMASNMLDNKLRRAEEVGGQQEAGPSGGGGGASASRADEAKKESGVAAEPEAPDISSSEGTLARGRAAAPAPAAAPAQESKAAAELQIDTDKAATIKLDEVDVTAENLQNAMLVYFAEIKAVDLSAPAYLETGVHLPDGWVYAREQIAKAEDWKKLAAPFFLKPGQIPDKITLSLVFTGKGSVLARNIRLER